MNRLAEQEIERLTNEKNELTRKLEIVASNLSVLMKVYNNSANEVVPTLGVAALEAMKSLKRFTRRELTQRIQHTHPGIKFNEASVVKPIKNALKAGHIKMVVPNQGNKTQAIFEWVKD